ncbi:amino acid adenylation domain-containing protein [Streptosporangium sp. NPDC050855]|uniref:amino acid adenylation domain-containing protein n=1 Tax=Streptosporangium sp. NPDC050855 TaxID=3366194 RepID=UPI0037A124C7
MTASPTIVPTAVPTTATVPELLAEVARRTPNAPALITPDRTLTHHELDAHTARLADVLREHGIGKGRRVMVLADRSWQGVCYLLAVLRAGAAYVPADPSDPPDRLREVVTLTAAGAVLGRAVLLSQLPPLGIPLIPAEPPGGLAAGAPPTARTETEPPSPDDLAYVMLTSGSTGTPKAVLVPHRTVTCATGSLGPLFGITPTDRVLHWTSLVWDTSGEEIYPALLGGGALVVDERVEARSVTALLAAIGEHRVTVVDLPTAMWNELVHYLAAGSEELSPGLRLVVIGGEAAQARTVRLWAERVPDRVRLLNTYGQTETVMVTHAAELGGPASRAFRDGDPVPIGRPLPHIHQVLVPSGDGPDELWIGGPSVAWGYADRPALTAAAFGPAPRTGGRFYRTGDLVRSLPDGSLAHAGRADRMLKVRGVRVEPAEVERAMTACPGVVAAAVFPVGNDPELLRLYGVFVPADTAPATEREVTEHCARRLPRALLPHWITAVPALPLLRTGKIDRVALRARFTGAAAPPEEASAETAPAGRSITARLTELFGQALGAPCSAGDSLFTRGGDSLTVIRLISLVHRDLAAELTFQDVFDHPTPRELAQLVEDSGPSLGEPQ